MHGLFTRLRKRLTFANVTSLTALFIALGGTSYAAISVGSAEIRTGAVGKSEIRTGAVGKAEIRSGAVGKSEARSNSIGRSEIATNGVGASELADNAVGSGEIADGSVAPADLAADTKSAFSLARASVSSSGGNAGGNAKAISHAAGTGIYVVEFDRDVSACTAGATIAAVKTGTTVEPAPNGRVTVGPGDANTKVQVSTFGADGATPADAPFNLLVAC
jgi:hypothetical protein